jgi:hypothetical protein
MIFSKKALWISLIIFLFAGLLLGKYFYNENIKRCSKPYEIDKVTEMTTHRMAFLDKKSGRSNNINQSIALIKSKNCDKNSTSLKIKPLQNVLRDADNYVKVFIDGKYYNKSSSTSVSHGRYKPHYLFWRQILINSIDFNLTMPQYDEFKKDELAIRCEFYSDGKLIDSIEDKIQYVNDGEEVDYVSKENFSGQCVKPKYFKNEVLFALNQKGWYLLEKEMITTITREDDRFKVVSESPTGYLQKVDDKSYRIPVPAFPEDIRYVDLSTNLIPGVYKRSSDPKYERLIEVTEDNLGEFLTYNYSLEMTSKDKTISFKDCEPIIHNSTCNYIPRGVFVTLEDYPEDLNNTYTSI